jgi:hypothetical protein
MALSMEKQKDIKVTFAYDRHGKKRKVCGICGKRASYGWEPSIPLRCSAHQEPDMQNVMEKRKCKEDSCTLRPSFGYLNEKPEYCNLHKTADMVNLTEKRVCRDEGCQRRASFGTEWNKPTHCAEHKTDNMRNVVSKTCEADECNKQPSYGILNKQPVCCFEHKKDGMVRMKGTCRHDGCYVYASFGVKEKQATHCLEHKTDDMVNVKNKRCEVEDCDINATFGLELGRATHCALHKSTVMFNVLYKPCEHVGCTKTKTFGVEQGKPTHCFEHKSPDMFDVLEKRLCKNEGCNKRVDNLKYNGYCVRCFIYLFPDQEVSKTYRVKEKHFQEFLIAHYPGIEDTIDKQVHGGCSKRRPDAYIDCLTHVLIIENDENQHVEYDTLCEEQRENDLFTDFGDRPNIYIRFNPDNYIREDGKKQDSCFHFHKRYDVPIIKDEKEWMMRTQVLKRVIDHHIQRVPEEAITRICLFFDRYKADIIS